MDIMVPFGVIFVILGVFSTLWLLKMCGFEPQGDECKTMSRFNYDDYLPYNMIVHIEKLGWLVKRNKCYCPLCIKEGKVK